ncbi:MAG: L-2-hydroxyglutarate oxidase [Planctomycetota bacterium]
MATKDADLALVGGGIVGLATAYRLGQRYPDLKVLVIEKEKTVGAHQTGHNSGVLHSGIYYKPGSLRAINCRAGKQAMERFCAEQNIPHEICGKVIVAIDESELPQLDKIYQRGQENGVRCELVGAERLREIEPHAAGIRAIHVPESGIVNYRRVCERLGELLVERGGKLVTGAAVEGVVNRPDGVILRTSGGEYTATHLVTCAGLHSDRVAKWTGQQLQSQIVPFRGEYYDLIPAAEHLCRNLIYPVPDPNFPFLGVHFTRMVDGGVECGPNAVLAFAREGYGKLDINPRDLWESLTFRGFQKLAFKHWRMGLQEMWRSLSKEAFVRAVQRLIPEIRSEHLVPARAGVRAQSLGSDGALVDDFVIVETERAVNVCNAPSPAATSALNVGQLVVDRLAPRLTAWRRQDAD